MPSLSPGSRVSRYTIIGAIGVGGMGEVYRARDEQLGRTVAIKVLPGELSSSDERARRFQLEARAASALNHPHIAAVHDSGIEGDLAFIVMELVDGVPVSGWISGQKPSLPRIVEVFTQMADAMAIAHEAGIVHRDLKPANVLVSREGYAKIVDFGVAKLLNPGAPGEEQTRVATQAGVAIGTPAYMAPEQLRGQGPDPRSDIFSFGVMFYESLTGRHPFAAASMVETIHAIMESDPPSVREAGRDLAPEIEWMSLKLLARDPRERYQTFREVAADLRRLRSVIERARESRQDGTRAGRPARYAVAGAAVAGAALVGSIWLLASMAGRGEPERQAPLALMPLTFEGGFEGEPTIAPDGQTLAYVSDRSGNLDVYLRQISGGPALNLTASPADDVQPAFSPDGRSIAFVSDGIGRPLRYASPTSPLLGGEIYVMSAFGGTPRRIAEGNFPSWFPDGSGLVFVHGRWYDRKLYRVGTAGGAPQEIRVEIEGISGQPGAPVELLTPRVSPDGRHIAFVLGGGLYTVPVSGGAAQFIAAGDEPAWSTSPLSLVYARADRVGQTLWRIPISTSTGRADGSPVPMTSGRAFDAQPAVSRNGRDVVFAAVDAASNLERLELTAEGLPASSVPQALTAVNDLIYFGSFAPDAGSVVYGSWRSGGIWLAKPGETPVRVSADTAGHDGSPRWSPDGRTIGFARWKAPEAEGPPTLWLMGADGSAPRSLEKKAFAGFMTWLSDAKSLLYLDPAERQLHRLEVETGIDRTFTNEPGVMPVTSASRDGQWVAYQSTDGATGDVTIRAIGIEGRPPSRLVLALPGENAYHPFFSPDGRWLYFTPDHKNIFRVPGPAQAWRQHAPEQVTRFPTSGLFLEDPQVSADGRWLLYARRRVAADLWLATSAAESR
ncbi:MAG TPA: protein kinase [Candidatus Polarisedimenticolia bacterium]|nr:protein kinase [Candidatus Polarisedimenticolia bacterium]